MDATNNKTDREGQLQTLYKNLRNARAEAIEARYALHGVDGHAEEYETAMYREQRLDRLISIVKAHYKARSRRVTR